MIDLYVCVGSACHIRGAYNVIHKFQKLIEQSNVEAEVTVKAALCLGSCSDKVSVRLGDGPVSSLSEMDVEPFFNREILSSL